MYRVLLVDDEPNILAALRRVLAAVRPDPGSDEPLTVEASSDPVDALQRFDEQTFDLVISDYRMAAMDGVTMLTEMHQRQPDVAAILLSAYADIDAVIAAINDARITRFISKPWNNAELQLAVCQALRTRALRLENDRLAALVRRQQGLIGAQDNALRRLEAEHPGLLHLRRDDSGAILIDEDDLDL